MTMRPYLAAAFVLALPALAGAQDFEGRVSYRASMGGMDMTMTHWIKGRKVRQEMSGPMGDVAVVVDLEAGRMAMFAPGHAEPMVMTLDEARAMGGGAPVPPGPLTVTGTGRTETIAGHECEHYVVEQGSQRSDVCAARGLGFYANAMDGGMGTGAGNASAWEGLRDRFSDGFFPLRISMTAGDGTMEIEVVSLERTSLSDELFRMDGGGDARSR